MERDRRQLRFLHKFSRFERFRPILWMATILHLIWGCLLVLYPEVHHITALTPPLFTGFRVSSSMLGLMLLTSSVLALWALNRDRDGVSIGTFWAMMPQQFFLMLSLTAALYFGIIGHYGDGVMRSRAFILADQLPIMLLALMHPFGLLRMHAPLFPVEG